MLVIIILLILSIILFILGYCDAHYWHTDGLEVVGVIIGSLTSIAFVIALGMIIVFHVGAPVAQAGYEERYERLIQKVEHIDSYNYEEIKAEVDEWNIDYRTNTYGPSSPWTNWFYTIDTSTTNFIKLN